ncbi:MAG: acetyltransferase [Anaerolineales bacterium]|jgi:sugar O-acyltransferase (sialic acid O-acetyltransferase NeuD family)
MSLQKVVIIGTGGFGREVLDVIEAVNQVQPTYQMLGFITEPGYQQPGDQINEAPVLGYYNWLEANRHAVKAICGVGAPAVRRRLVRKAEAAGAAFFSLVHPRAILTRWVTLGSGTIITAGCILTNNIRLGNHVHLNLDCTVGHDAVLEDFVTVSPGVHISGNVTLQQGSFIGTGANLIEGKTVGEWSVVGAGSVVVNDIPPNATAVGTPAKEIKTRPPGWHLQESN